MRRLAIALLALEGPRIVTIAGGGHFLFRDTPELVLREIDAFLSG